jgi:hypothetical protein
VGGEDPQRRIKIGLLLGAARENCGGWELPEATSRG